MKSILLCGVGGQGTVLASKLIAQCAMNQGFMARSAETIGMAQRGGSVFSHVRYGEEISSSLIPLGQADVIVGFEPGEAVRCLPYLKKGGAVVVSTKPVQPISSFVTEEYTGAKEIDFLKQHVDKLMLVDPTKSCEKLKSSKILNVLLLGALVSTGELGLSMEQMKETVKQRIPAKFLDLNLKALDESHNWRWQN